MENTSDSWGEPQMTGKMKENKSQPLFKRSCLILPWWEVIIPESLSDCQFPKSCQHCSREAGGLPRERCCSWQGDGCLLLLLLNLQQARWHPAAPHGGPRRGRTTAGAGSETPHSARKIAEEMVAGRASCPAGVGAQEVVPSLSA